MNSRSTGRRDFLPWHRGGEAALRDGGIRILLAPDARDVPVMGESFREEARHVRPYPAALLQGMRVSGGVTAGV